MLVRVVTRTIRGSVVCVTFPPDVQQARQRFSIPSATNKGKPWTEDDRAVALDRSLTTLQAAKSLGRTAYAIRTIRRDAAREEREAATE